jgi:RHS repeat-associated protein
LGGQLLGSSDGFFILQDVRGDVVALVSNGIVGETNGKIVGAYTYDAFGSTRSIQEIQNITSPFRFAGGLYDSSSGNYIFGVRMYAPDQGRWLSKDSYLGSAEDPLSLHRYVYCHNDPVNYVDPSGFREDDQSGRGSGYQVYIFVTDDNDEQFNLGKDIIPPAIGAALGAKYAGVWGAVGGVIIGALISSQIETVEKGDMFLIGVSETPIRASGVLRVVVEITFFELRDGEHVVSFNKKITTYTVPFPEPMMVGCW